MSLPSDNLLQPDAYTVSDEQSRGALRCIDRNVPDLPDRIEVAQALGLLPCVAHSRRADRTSGPPVERRPSCPAVSWRHLGDDQPPVWRVGKKRAGRLLDGAQHDGYPGGEA